MIIIRFCLILQRIRHTVNTTEQGRLLMDLDVSMRLSNYPFAIQFYGALFKEVRKIFY